MRGTGLHMQIAAEMQEAGSEVLRAISGLSDEQMSMPAIDGWSVKDHLNHMTVWHEFRFHEISRIARGGRPAFPPFTDEQLEAVNSVTVALRRSLPVSQVLADLEFALVGHRGHSWMLGGGPSGRELRRGGAARWGRARP